MVEARACQHFQELPCCHVLLHHSNFDISSKYTHRTTISNMHSDVKWHWPSKKTTSAQGKLLPTDMKIDAQNCSTSHTNINNKHTKSKTLTQTDCHLGFFGWKATNLSFPKISKKTCIALEGIPSTSVHKQAPRQLRRQNFRQDKITEV